MHICCVTLTSRVETVPEDGKLLVWSSNRKNKTLVVGKSVRVAAAAYVLPQPIETAALGRGSGGFFGGVAISSAYGGLLPPHYVRASRGGHSTESQRKCGNEVQHGGRRRIDNEMGKRNNSTVTNLTRA